jgi:RNA polymerase sigma-70 factor, ECF subfamily
MAGMTSTSESLLRSLAGPASPSAWERFVEICTPLIFHWGRRSGLTVHNASDLVQDVFAIFLRHLPRFEYDRQRSFRGWLRTVTVNRFRELARRRHPVTGQPEALAAIADENTLASSWDTAYRQDLVAHAVRSLEGEFSPPVWKALTDLLASGLPARDVASLHGISVWTLYAAKSRLLRRLRTELDGMLD